jgi:hypothetical protein
MTRTFLMLAASLVGAPLVAGQMPSTDVPYARYRQQMLENGWQPVPYACRQPYPETCTGRAVGTARWRHPVSKQQSDLLLWPCRHGWCLAAPIIPAAR